LLERFTGLISPMRVNNKNWRCNLNVTFTKWQTFPYEELFCILPACKSEREQKIDKAGGSWAREGTLARKLLDFEKCPPFFMVEFI